MAVAQNFISKYFRKLLSFLGFSDETLQVLGGIYWQYKLYGFASFTKDPLKGVKILQKRIHKKNKKFVFIRNIGRCISIGDFTDLSRTEVYPGDYNTKLTVGKYCSVSWDVSFLLGTGHIPEFNTTYTFGRSIMAYKHIKNEMKKGDIAVGNDVWIASGVKILAGVKIGDGAVIGANSLVTKDVPKYAIYGGNPAKLIRMRFTDDIIKIFEEIKWWDWPIEDINKTVPILQSTDIAALKRYYEENIMKQKNGA